MKTCTYSFVLLSYTLCHGANKEAELRESSIRGHLRRWHRILWGQEDTVFCWGTAGARSMKPAASKVTLRLSRPKNEDKTKTSTFFLPHKKVGNVPALAASPGIYTLGISFRYLNAQNAERVVSHVKDTIRCWLLMGTVGQRSTRAFGSVWPQDDPPDTPDAFQKMLKELLNGKQYAFRLSPVPKDSPDLSVCTDTLKIGEYFGFIKTKESPRDCPDRKTSPLKMKYVRLGGKYYLLLHAEKMDTIDGAIDALKDKNKRIGDLFD